MSIFSSVSVPANPRSKFDLSHDVKLSFDMGKLIPIMCQEVIPGDKFRCQVGMMARFAPMLAPVMHNIDAFVYFFYVPTRIIWENFQDFLAGEMTGSSQVHVPPYINFKAPQAINQWARVGSLMDYFGLPVVGEGESAVTGYPRFSSLPFRAYQLIYNEYIRDQNVTDEIPISLADGDDLNLGALLTMRYKAWEKDYFTSALPDPQRGPDVMIPLGDTAPVIYEGTNMQKVVGAAGVSLSDGSVSTKTDVNYGQTLYSTASSGVSGAFNIDPNGTLKTDLSNASGISVNDFRWYNQLQRFMERLARGGSRYRELLWNFFQVRSSDASLQRPQFLGGGRIPIQISEVMQNSATSSTSPQGNMAGAAYALSAVPKFNRFFEEPGYCIGLMAVKPRSCYQQGISRMWTRSDRFDYYWPQFAHLGEQEVKNKELYYDPATPLENQAELDGTFGYQSRYAEYKYQASRVCGDFRKTLDFWHMGRIFDEPPTLSTEFIEVHPDNRNFAVTTETQEWNKIYAQIHIDLRASRQLPYYGTPRL